MQISVILIVLLAAFCHAAWNAAVKTGEDKMVSMAGMKSAGALIVFPALFVVGLPHPDSWPWLIASVIFHNFYYVALSQAYRLGDFSVAYPVARGVAPVLVTLIGVIFLHEHLTTLQWVAISSVTAGILIFATARLGRVVQNPAGLVVALLTALLISLYTLADGVGVRASQNVPAYVLWLAFLNLWPFLLLTFCIRPKGVFMKIVRTWKVSLGAAVLSISAYGLVLWAMTQAPIPLVSVLRETSIIIAALIGAYYFKEPSGIRRIIAAIVVFIGIALLALGAFDL